MPNLPNQPVILPQNSPTNRAKEDGLFLLGAAPVDFSMPVGRDFNLPPPQMAVSRPNGGQIPEGVVMCKVKEESNAKTAQEKRRQNEDEVLQHRIRIVEEYEAAEVKTEKITAKRAAEKESSILQSPAPPCWVSGYHAHLGPSNEQSGASKLPDAQTCPSHLAPRPCFIYNGYDEKDVRSAYEGGFHSAVGKQQDLHPERKFWAEMNHREKEAEKIAATKNGRKAARKEELAGSPIWPAFYQHKIPKSHAPGTLQQLCDRDRVKFSIPIKPPSSMQPEESKIASTNQGQDEDHWLSNPFLQDIWQSMVKEGSGPKVPAKPSQNINDGESDNNEQSNRNGDISHENAAEGDTEQHQESKSKDSMVSLSTDESHEKAPEESENLADLAARSATDHFNDIMHLHSQLKEESEGHSFGPEHPKTESIQKKIGPHSNTKLLVKEAKNDPWEFAGTAAAVLHDGDAQAEERKPCEKSNAELLQRFKTLDRKHAERKVEALLIHRMEGTAAANLAATSKASQATEAGCACNVCAQLKAYDVDKAKILANRTPPKEKPVLPRLGLHPFNYYRSSYDNSIMAQRMQEKISAHREHNSAMKEVETKSNKTVSIMDDYSIDREEPLHLTPKYPVLRLRPALHADGTEITPKPPPAKETKPSTEEPKMRADRGQRGGVGYEYRIATLETDSPSFAWPATLASSVEMPPLESPHRDSESTAGSIYEQEMHTHQPPLWQKKRNPTFQFRGTWGDAMSEEEELEERPLQPVEKQQRDYLYRFGSCSNYEWSSQLRKRNAFDKRRRVREQRQFANFARQPSMEPKRTQSFGEFYRSQEATAKRAAKTAQAKLRGELLEAKEVETNRAPVETAAPSLPANVDTDEDEDSEKCTTKCICLYTEHDVNTIYCKNCNTWQHIACYYPSRREEMAQPDFEQVCQDCKPIPLVRRRAREIQHCLRENWDDEISCDDEGDNRDLVEDSSDEERDDQEDSEVIHVEDIEDRNEEDEWCECGGEEESDTDQEVEDDFEVIHHY